MKEKKKKVTCKYPENTQRCDYRELLRILFSLTTTFMN